MTRQYTPEQREKQKQYKRDHYQRNKQYYKDKAKARREKVNRENGKLIWDYLNSHPCIDCGESDVDVLQFDHVRGEKEFNVSDLYRRGYSWQKILEEIEKCDIRCANCHVRRTRKQLGWKHHLDL